MNIPIKDLILLVPDRDIEATLKGLLNRHKALGIRPVTFDIRVHPNRDPGCYGESDRFLQSFIKQYYYSLVVFDYEGCGCRENRNEAERKVEDKLNNVGWAERSRAIVLYPELEIWVWNKSPHVEEVLGWKNQEKPLRQWLVDKGYCSELYGKPERPKEAMEAVLRVVKKPRSSAIYQQLAERVSLDGHTEPAFVKLKESLFHWFKEA